MRFLENSKKLLFTIYLILFFGLVSCKKDEVTTEVTVDEVSVGSESGIDATMLEVDNTVEQSLSVDYASSARVNADTITADDMVFGSCTTKKFYRLLGKKIIVYDTIRGCIGYGGRVRKGTITIDYTPNAAYPLFPTRSVTFKNFYIDSIKVEGTRVITFKGATADFLTYTHEISLKNGKFTWPDGSSATREETKTRTYTINSIAAKQVTKVTYSGDVTGTNRNGKTYLSKVSEKTPLIFSIDCLSQGKPVCTQGILEHIVDGTTYSIDYGEGVCDNTAIITVNGKSKEITINTKKKKS